MNTNANDVLILGGGPAGLTAAIYTSRASLKTFVVAGNPSGGQLSNTTDVENYPGFPVGILGPELIRNMRSQAEKFGAEFIDQNVVSMSGSFDEMFTVATDGGGLFVGKAVIVATGASARWLGIESEQRLIGKGVSACATCDGFFFRGKVVAVVGGGDAAMEEALFMTKFSPKVHLLVRSDRLGMRASKIMIQRATDNPKIEFHFDTEVIEVLGETVVEGLKVINNGTKEEGVMRDVKGVFIAIGHKPNTGFLKGFVDVDHMGYVRIDSDNPACKHSPNCTLTSKKGVFVAGDVYDFRYRQAVTAAGFGCMAAIDVERFLAESYRL